jgi:threonine/homoserine/homoserine lactone efflux protein
MTPSAIFCAAPWQASLALVLTALAVMGSPGPSTMAVTASGAAFGFRRSIGFVCGAIAGTVVVLLAVAIGVVALLLSIPGLGVALALASSAYILYLAWKIATAPPLLNRANARAPSLAAGLLLAVANPKAWLAIGAVFAGSTLVESSPAIDALVKTVLLAAMIAIIHLFWLWCGVGLAQRLADSKRSRIVNILFALILVGTVALALAR